MRPKLKAEHPAASLGDLATLLSEQWRAVGSPTCVRLCVRAVPVCVFVCVCSPHCSLLRPPFPPSQLSYADRQPYIDLSKSDKARYDSEMVVYLNDIAAASSLPSSITLGAFVSSINHK